MDMKKTAEQLLQRGYEPIPIKPGEKHPTVKSWPTADCTQLVKNWPHNHGIGLRTGPTLTGIDIDVYDSEMIEAVIKALAIFNGDNFLRRVGKPPKTLIPAYCEDVEKKITSNKWLDENGAINQIEILSSGQQFVAFGIHPDTGKPYEWSGDLLSHSLPVIPQIVITGMLQKFDRLAAARGWRNLSQAAETAKKVTTRQRKSSSTGEAPSEVYNRSVPLETVLEHYGWTHCRGEHWTRPGKDQGISGAVHGGVLYCFTSSTCLDADQCHDAFEIVSRYEFDGDKSACSLALRRAIQEVR